MNRVSAHSTDECLATDCHEAWELMLVDAARQGAVLEVPSWVREAAWKGIELELSP